MIARLRVKRAIQADPGIGPAKAAAALDEAEIKENRRVGRMTAAQRERLLAHISA